MSTIGEAQNHQNHGSSGARNYYRGGYEARRPGKLEFIKILSVHTAEGLELYTVMEVSELKPKTYHED